MVKSIIKEVFIIILITIAVVLVLGILLYEYNPTSKKAPGRVEAYVLSEDMQKELNETVVENQKQNIIKTYRVDAQDLQVYKNSKDYDQGKVNPFDKVGVSSSVSGNNSGNTTNSSNSTSNGTASSNSNTSQGSFLNTVGK